MNTEFMPVISKNTFCNALRDIRKQLDIYTEVEKNLSKVMTGHFVIGSENLFLLALMSVLKEGVNDKYDYIDWWLYETDDYTVESSDGKQKWYLKEPEALYDYIVTEA